MKNFLETKKLQLNCLTPVHIGSGSKLNKNEYIFDKNNGIVYLLQQNKWLEFLYNYEPETPKQKINTTSIKGFEALAQAMGCKTKDFLQEYKKFIINNAGSKNPKSLYQWCRDNDIKMSAAAKCALAETYISSEKNDLNDMMPFVRHADGSIYIPGSSIKGAVRTALLYEMIKKAPQYNSWQRELKNINPHDKKTYGKLAKTIEKAVFNKYTGFFDNKGVVTDARADIMRGLRIGDAELCDKGTKTQIYRKYDISLHKNKQGESVRKLPLYRECAPSGSNFEFAVTLEKQFLQGIGINSIEDVLKITNSYVDEIIDMEKGVFDQYGEYWNGKENMANIIIGGGTGFLTKTIIYALLPRQEAVNVVKNYLDSAFTIYDRKAHGRIPAHNHKMIDTKLSPRTLKVAGDMNKMYHMGLGQIVMN